MCPTLWTLSDFMDCGPPGSSIRGILQAAILECCALLQGVFLTRGLNLHLLPALAGGFFTTGATWEAPPLGYLELNNNAFPCSSQTPFSDPHSPTHAVSAGGTEPL